VCQRERERGREGRRASVWEVGEESEGVCQRERERERDEFISLKMRDFSFTFIADKIESFSLLCFANPSPSI